MSITLQSRQSHVGAGARARRGRAGGAQARGGQAGARGARGGRAGARGARGRAAGARRARERKTHIPKNNGCLRLGVVKTDIDDNIHQQMR
jgi:hypothetical protein